ncbi:prepilin-type N-terminal cleavage/methylation domain-containing protein [Candidatus Berkelbacteria bacterium]|nr:prepilin-type N-terminal cleavage/methylation domain-containing protein [Candidatus Berkelbacteria bacterium]
MKRVRKGFTLIEILLASTIFVSVMLIAMAGFTQVLKIQRKTTGSSLSTYVSRFPLEEMSREIRMAKTVEFPTGSTSTLKIKTQDGTLKCYSINDGRLTVVIGCGIPPQLTYLSDSNPDSKITNLSFSGYATISNATKQPFVTIQMTISGTQYQTTVTLRNYQKYQYQ